MHGGHGVSKSKQRRKGKVGATSTGEVPAHLLRMFGPRVFNLVMCCVAPLLCVTSLESSKSHTNMHGALLARGGLLPALRHESKLWDEAKGACKSAVRTSPLWGDVHCTRQRRDTEAVGSILGKALKLEL